MKCITVSARERETDRQTDRDRETDRDRQTDRNRERQRENVTLKLVYQWLKPQSARATDLERTAGTDTTVTTTFRQFTIV